MLLESSQTSSLEGGMTRRGHSRDTQGLITFCFFPQTWGIWVHSVYENPSGRTNDLCNVPYVRDT